MKHFQMTNPEGSEIVNLTAPSGSPSPASPNIAELFYKTGSLRLEVHNGTTWDTLALQADVDAVTAALAGYLPLTGGTLTGSLTVLSGSPVSQFYAPNGSTTVPGYSFTSDPDTGIYTDGAGTFRITVAGTQHTSFNNSALQIVNTGIRLAIGRAGTAASPTIYLANDTDTGISHPADNTIIISTTGIERFRVAADGLLSVNSVGSPTYANLVTADDDIPNKKYVDDVVSGSGHLSNVIEDTSPQLGANLDVNGFDINTTTNDIIDITGYFNTGGIGGGVAVTGGASTTSTGGSASVAGGQGTTGAAAVLRGGTGTSASGGQAQIAGGNGPTGGGRVRIQVGRDTTDGSFDGWLDFEKPSGLTAPVFRFHEAGSRGTRYVALKAPDAMTGSPSVTARTWVLPTDDPAAVDGYFLTTDASGVLSFASVPATLAGLTDTTITIDGSPVPDKDILYYDGGTSKWINGTGTEAGVLELSGGTMTGALTLADSGSPQPRILNAGGTAALPSYSFVSDPSTGMYTNGTNQIAFSTAGTLRMDISALGTVTFHKQATVISSGGSFIVAQAIDGANDAAFQGHLTRNSSGTSVGFFGSIPSDLNSAIAAYGWQTSGSPDGWNRVFGAHADSQVLQLTDGDITYDGVSLIPTAGARITDSGGSPVDEETFVDTTEVANTITSNVPASGAYQASEPFRASAAGGVTINASDSTVGSGGAGANVTINGGDAGNVGTGIGGSVTITAGRGAPGTFTGGGNINLTCSAATLGETGGAINLTSGEGTRDGGAINITTGDGNGSSGSGGDITIAAGAAAPGTTDGGFVLIKSGTGGSTTGDSGRLDLQTGGYGSTGESFGVGILGPLGETTAAGELRIYDAESISSQYIGLTVADNAIVSSITYTLPELPTGSPFPTQFLTTDNSGVMSWGDVPTPATTLGGLTDVTIDGSPAPTVNEVLAYVDGSPATWAPRSIANLTSSVATVTHTKYTATSGSPAQDTFTGPDDNGDGLSYVAGYLDVYLNGVLLVDTVDYTATSGTSVVLTTAATGGDILQTTAHAAALGTSTPEFIYTAVGGSPVETTFSGADDNSNTLSYIPGQTYVFKNGVMLANGTDYTATDGTSVVLTVAATALDTIQIIAPVTFTVASAYTKAESDAQFAPISTGRKNLIINGDFGVAQRGTSFTGLSGFPFTLDRWRWTESGTSIVDISQVSNSSEPPGRAYMSMAVTTGDAAFGATEYAGFLYQVEGNDAIAFGWNSVSQSDKKNLTLSFWSAHHTTGTYCVAFRNSATDRSYIAEYTQAVANTWEKQTINVSAPTDGTWLVDEGRGLQITFSMGAGTTLAAPAADTWYSADYHATSNQVNNVASTSCRARLAGVQLEVGDIATDFEFRSFAEELAMCQRYYERWTGNTNQPTACMMAARSTSLASGSFPFKVTKASDSPTVTLTGTFGILGAAGESLSSWTTSAVNADGVQIDWNDTGTPFTTGFALMLTAAVTTAYIEVDSEI